MDGVWELSGSHLGGSRPCVPSGQASHHPLTGVKACGGLGGACEASKCESLVLSFEHSQEG